MKRFFSVQDIQGSLRDLVKEAVSLKQHAFEYSSLGKNKTIGLVFLNPSLRTRMSTQIAAANLGMNVIVMNMDKDGWALETQDGIIMNGTTVEHMREAAAVMGSYCHILGLRSFPKLQDRDEDYSEDFFKKFESYANIPVVSLESATRHPLQSLTDLITISENWNQSRKPKVVLAWAPHIKSLPQAVPNSFSEWMGEASRQGLLDFSIANPVGYDLQENFREGIEIERDLSSAIQGADFVYVKNWSSFENYGAMPRVEEDWMIDLKKLENNKAKIMHCLPVRRDLELGADVLDSDRSLVIEEASNRVWAAQVVLKRILENK